MTSIIKHNESCEAHHSYYHIVNIVTINNDKDGNMLSRSMMIFTNLCKHKYAYVIMIACMR